MTENDITSESAQEGGDGAEYQDLEDIDAEEEMRLIIEGRR